MPTGILVHEFAVENERHRFEAAMRMRPERQAAIVRRINLRPVVIQEQEWVDLRHARPRQGTARHEIRDVVAL